MKVVKEEYYSLYSSYDRDSTEHWRTTDFTVAEQWEKKSCYNGYNKVEKTHIYIDSLEDIAEAEIAAMKQAALNKLTAAERKLLGLK
jgi:hypothetical protein